MIEFIPDEAHFRLKIITHYNEGWSIRRLCRHYGISRNRVRRILRAAQARRTEDAPVPPTVNQRQKRSSKLDLFLPAMKDLLGKYPKITGVRMFEELRIQGYQGGQTILRELLKQLRPKPRADSVIRFETGPGEQGQMDWSPYTIHFSRTGKSGVLCFSCILAFSRRQYIDFTLTRDFHSLIRRHRDAFEYFGGVPLQCLYDSEKTVVLRWEGGQPVFNPSYIDFITHYRCKPIACQRRTPRTKGKVERPFQYGEGNLLNGRTPVDFDDLRTLRMWWMKEISDTHIHDTTHRAPQELFMAEERSCLQPLPAQPYDCSEVVFRVCPNDAFIEFETNLYSVPFGHMGEIVSVKATEQEIFIYSPYLDLLGSEARAVVQRRIERRIKESRLPDRKLLTDFDFAFQTGLDKAQILELATLSFVQRKQSVILAGASGTGKSHIAKAFLLIGCQLDYRCRYTTAADMLKTLMAGLADGSLEQKLKLYISPQLLLIDEVGFDRIEQESARNASIFFKVIDGRYCKASTILTTNIDFKALGDYLGDPIVTTAIVDRMIHHATIISIDGPSYRMSESKKINSKSARKKN